MSAAAAAVTTSASTGQGGAATDGASSTTGAANSNGSASATTTEKPKVTSILGSVDDPKNETKPDGEQGKQTGEGKPNATGAASELEIKLPDGITADPAVLKEFQSIAKKVGLDSEKASELAAWELKRQQTVAAAQVSAWEKQGQTWEKQLAEDPDLGGPKLNETVLAAKKALRKYGGEPLANALADLGIGSHPELVRAFARIGRAMAEDSSDAGGGGKPSAATDEQTNLRKLYPSMFNEDGSPKK